MTASPPSGYGSLELLFFPFEILFPHVFFIAKCTKEIIFFLLISFITKDNNNYFSACFTIFLKNIIVFFIMSHLKLNAKKNSACLSDWKKQNIIFSACFLITKKWLYCTFSHYMAGNKIVFFFMKKNVFFSACFPDW